MRFSFRTRIGFSGLVDSNDPELIPFTLTETWNPGLQLIYSCYTVLIVCDKGIEPAAEFVFLLNDIVRNGTATIMFGFIPSQGDRFVVKINNLRFSRCTRRS